MHAYKRAWCTGEDIANNKREELAEVNGKQHGSNKARHMANIFQDRKLLGETCILLDSWAAVNIMGSYLDGPLGVASSRPDLGEYNLRDVNGKKKERRTKTMFGPAKIMLITAIIQSQSTRVVSPRRRMIQPAQTSLRTVIRWGNSLRGT